MNYSYFSKSLIMAFVVALTSCSGIRGMRQKEVHVVVTNNSSKDMTDVQIHFGKHVVMPGPHCLVAKGSNATVLDYPHATDGIAVVEWTFERENYRKDVDLKNILPRRGKGKLVFVVQGNQVTASFQQQK